ncbi:MAG: hypothetical protein WCX73_03940 [Candidatus Pacearchaeota archaeon]|jgi:hypothetical protein
MELQVDEKLVLPKQKLEEKLAFVAKITHVFGCDSRGIDNRTAIEMSNYIRIQITNKSDKLNGSSGQIYDPKTFKEFMQAYNIKDSDNLVGKPVISVYTKDKGQMLSGLIPLNMDK